MQQPAQSGGRGIANLGEDQDENQIGVSAGTIFGLKKTVFNSTDFGTVVVASYGASH